VNVITDCQGSSQGPLFSAVICAAAGKMGSALFVRRRCQARSYVQARGGSCLIVPRRLNIFDTQINVMRNCV